MARIYFDKGQAKITIPKAIMALKGWSKDTEVLVTPYFQDPMRDLDENTPITIKEIKRGKHLEPKDD